MPDAKAQQWLRRNGLPTLVPFRHWQHDLARRTVPGITFVVSTVFFVQLFAVAFGYVEPTQLPLGYDILALVMLILILVCPALLAWLTRWIVYRWSHPLLPWAILIATMFFDALATFVIEPDAKFWRMVAGDLVVLGVVLVLVWMGVGSVLMWTVRSVVSHLGAILSMAAALPLILGLVVFAFFSAETWQVTDSMSWASLFGVGAVVVVLGLAVLLPASRRALEGVRAESADKHVPLRMVHRFNILLVMVTTQLLLTAVFVVFFAALLVVLGRIAVSGKAMSAWLSHPAVPFTVGDTTLPVSLSLIKVAIFLGFIAGMTFMVSLTSDDDYRETFFAPVLVQVRQALAVRAHLLFARHDQPVEGTDERGGRHVGEAE